MMIRQKTIRSSWNLFALLLGIVTLNAVALRGEGNDVNVFGYFQGNVWKYDSDPSPQTSTTVPLRSTSLEIGQANVFISKTSDNGLSGFINLEFVNNFSSAKGWGSFALQEAFVRYESSNSMVLKCGLFIPAFNNLYEIYNRTPLLPYLFRPMLYETQLAQVTNIFEILPSRAFAQVSGFQRLGDLKLDYAAHIGNAEGFIESPNNVLHPDYIGYGQNASPYLSYGGRLGLRYGTMKLGVSAVKDVNNKKDFQIDYEATRFGHFGDLDRLRLGADFSMSLGDFTLSAEYLRSVTNLSASQKDSLSVWSTIPNSQVGADFNALAYYATLLYDINDAYFVYAMVDRLRDNGRPFFVGVDGMTAYSIGGGYRMSDGLVLKVQFCHNKSTYLANDDQGAPIMSTISDKYYLAGFSYSF